MARASKRDSSSLWTAFPRAWGSSFFATAPLMLPADAGAAGGEALAFVDEEGVSGGFMGAADTAGFVCPSTASADSGKQVAHFREIS